MLLRYKLDIDWSLLAEQKRFLWALIEADAKAGGLTFFGPYEERDHPLQGLLHLIDSIQWQGEQAGQVVHESPDDDEPAAEVAHDSAND